METFDNLIRINENGDFVTNQWVEWNHFLIPNKPEWFRALLRSIMALSGHCMNCSALDGCYFVKRNMPKQPLHEHCDCDNMNVGYSKVKSMATAECDIRKFTEYVFKDSASSNGKNKIFYNLGYNIDDSQYLKYEFCKQALKQYLSGNYILKNLDRMGQRVAIPICLNDVNFYSGWIFCPEGKIKNTTPFGGWVK